MTILPMGKFFSQLIHRLVIKSYLWLQPMIAVLYMKNLPSYVRIKIR